MGDGAGTITELVAGNNDKKIRPAFQRQADIYGWVRRELDRAGCQDVAIAACKGNPDELLPLVHTGIIDAMSCACYGTKARTVVQTPDVRKQLGSATPTATTCRSG